MVPVAICARADANRHTAEMLSSDARSVGSVSAPPASERMHGELIKNMARQHGTSRENIAYVISKWKRDVEKERRSRD